MKNVDGVKILKTSTHTKTNGGCVFYRERHLVYVYQLKKGRREGGREREDVIQYMYMQM